MKKVFDQSTHQLVKRSTILFQYNAERIMWSHFREEKPKTKNLRLTDNKRKINEIPYPFYGVLRDIYLKRYSSSLSPIVLKGGDYNGKRR